MHHNVLFNSRRPSLVPFWLSLFWLLVCGPLRAQTPADIAQLNQQLTPITALQAGSGFADLTPLAPLVASARVVGLGECTHGTHEVFQLKHRLLEYLVTQQGFTTLALEVDYGSGEVLNDYIQTGAGDPKLVRQAAGFDIWNTTEFWDMVEWMRTYNQQHPVKIRYVGIDMQDATPNLLRLEQFATQRTDTVLRRQVRQLRALYGAPGGVAAANQPRVVRLSDELAQHLQAVAAPAAVQQHGQVLRQRAGLLTARNYIQLRDRQMADNAAWLLRQEPAAKVVLWAHNLHVQHNNGYPLLGHYLFKQLGKAYVAVGFATGRGKATVFPDDGPVRSLALTLPIPNSAESWLDQATAENYLLDLRRAAATSQWLTKSLKFRSIGYKEPSGGAEGQFMVFPPLPKTFDALIYLRETSASQPRPAAQEK